MFFFQGTRTAARTVFLALFCAGNLSAQTTNAPLSAPPFPEAGASLLRVTGGLALVLGLFLGGVWFFKNWQRLTARQGRQPRLNICESRSLGARQAIFVVGYDKQRFLVAASPAGVNLLTHLPDAEPAENSGAENAPAPMSFAQALAHVLQKK